MNLPALFRRALHVLFPARSPQQPEPTRGVAAVPARDWDDETNPANRTKWIPVEKARARVRDQVDQFPPRPAAPRDRGTDAPGPDPVDMWEPHNLPRSRWFK